MADLDRNGLVLACMPIFGDLLDRSANTGDGSFSTPDAADLKTIGGKVAFMPSALLRWIKIPYNANRNVDALTYVFMGRFGFADGAPIYRYPAANPNRIGSAGAALVQHYNSAGIPVTYTRNQDTQFMIITKGAGSVVGSLYDENGFKSNSSAAYTVGNPANEMRLFYTITGPTKYEYLHAYLEYNVAKTATEIASLIEYLQGLTTPRHGTKHFVPGGQNPLYLADYGSIAASEATLAAGEYIDEAGEWRVHSGTFKPFAANVNGEACKYIEPKTTPSSAYLEVPEHSSGYGTWEFSVHRHRVFEITRFCFCCDGIGPLTANWNGYYVQLYDEGISLKKWTAGVAATLFSGTGLTATDETIRITRDLSGEFSIYVNGVLWVAAIGANPVTENTFTSGKYINLDVSPASTDRFYLASERDTYSFKHLKDVVTP